MIVQMEPKDLLKHYAKSRVRIISKEDREKFVNDVDQKGIVTPVVLNLHIKRYGHTFRCTDGMRRIDAAQLLGILVPVRIVISNSLTRWYSRR